MQPNDQMLAAAGLTGQATDKLGRFNDMPPNWVTITESEYLWRFQGHWTHEFRQCQLPTVAYKGDRDTLGDRTVYCDVHLWVAPDLSGVGFIKHYNGAVMRTEEDAFWPQYFRWEYCQHDFETTVQRMSYWEGKCRKCGFVKFVDSSD